MSADYTTRSWEAEGEVLEVLFGNGTVSVGGLRLGALVSLCLGELPEPQEVGAQVRQAHDAERVRLTFSRVASIDVVLKHLRALRWHLSHQCCACGGALEASGHRCADCNAQRSPRTAEPGSEEAMMREFMRQHREFQKWAAEERAREGKPPIAADPPCE